MTVAVSAGDVGRFAYCPLNWQRSQEGERGAGGQGGLRHHAEVSEHVDALEYYQHHVRLTQDSALLLGLFAASGAALGVEFFALDRSEPWWWLLVFLSVLWMGASLYLVVFNLYYKGRAQLLVRTAHLPRGEVVYKDSGQRPAMLESRVLPLRGRPDFVVEREGAVVPVEVKSGRTPPAPYESHVLQLAAYCYLVGEHYGKRPTHGVLAYPEKQFDVAYTGELENRLVKILLRIQVAAATSDVHRDHENPRRCAGCSRREGCPERLA